MAEKEVHQNHAGLLPKEEEGRDTGESARGEIERPAFIEYTGQVTMHGERGWAANER